jgi:predicted PurR-regulated permease PerM
VTKHRAALIFLAALTGLALYLCYLLFVPFLKPIIFAAILAIIFFPIQAHMSRRIRNRNISAAITTVAVILLLVLGSVFLGGAIVSGLRDVYKALAVSSGNSGAELLRIVERATAFINRYVPVSIPDMRDAFLTQAEKVVSGTLAAITGVLGSVTSLLANAFIAFFILFFLLRDGKSILRRAAVVLPLRPDQAARLFGSLKETLNAIVYGTLAIAAVQGILTGIAFWFLGLSSAALWGMVTGLCALVPVIGTAFVLFPALLVLISGGHWIKSLILLFWALAIVHPIDNLWRPYLIGERVRLSTLYVFFALLGGLKAFGALGVFIGPLVLAMTVALFRFLREERREDSWKSAEDTQSAVQSGPVRIAKDSR